MPVPRRVWTQLGPVPVRRVRVCVSPDDGEPCFGTYDPNTRVIEIDRTVAPAVQLQKAMHEWVHALLLDAGLRLGAKEESVCETIANGISRQFFPKG